LAGSGCAFLIQRSNRSIQNGLKSRLIGDRQVSQRLPIYLNFRGGQSFDKTAVRSAILATRGINSLNPKVSKIAFPGLAVTVSPVLRFHRGVFGIAEKLGPTPSISFGAVENSYPALSARRRVSCPWHFLLSGIRRILTHRLLFHISLSDLTRRISPENFRGRRKAIASFSVKRQVFFYPCFIGRIEHCALSEMTLALCTFGHQQVSTARVATQHFAGRRYLEAFRHRFFGFASRYRFWHREPGTYTLESSSQLETHA
jgi:hypothetical protein